jgi:hypothetical protein
MRLLIGTKSGESALITFATNSPMACFAAPSFHEGNGSTTAEDSAAKAP